MQVFAHGFALALGLILPLGVQNVFIFNQGAQQASIWRALPAVLTAAICDTLLIISAVFGVSMLLFRSVWLTNLFIGTGIVFLFYMGWITWRSSNSSRGMGEGEAYTGKRQVLFALSVSLLNPHAIMDTVGVIGTSSLHYSGWDKAAFTLSCILVSWLWFFGLSVAGRWIKAWDGAGRIHLFLNRVSALIIWGTAVVMAQQLL